jgi:hypothetical protein
LPGVPDELLEQLPFGRGQVQIEVSMVGVDGRGAGDAMVLQVDQVVADPDAGGVVADRNATGDRPQTGQQLVDVEGLGDVVVGAGVEGVDLGRALAAAGQDDEGASEQRLGSGLQQAVAAPAEQAERGLGLPGRPRVVAVGERGRGGRQRRSTQGEHRLQLGHPRLDVVSQADGRMGGWLPLRAGCM